MPNLQVNSNLSSTAQWVIDGTYGSALSLTNYATGRVGIGTNAPNATFEASKGAGTGEILRLSGSNNPRMKVSVDSSDTSVEAMSGNNLKFGTSEGGMQLTVANNGNVGIGTTGPQYKLHIEGNDTRIVNKGNTSTGYSTINAMNSDGDNIELVAYGRSAFGTYLGQDRGGGLFLGGQPEEVMGIGTKNETPLVIGTNNYERMRITAGGKFGIGTTSLDDNVLILEVSNTVTSVYSADNECHAIKLSPTMNPHAADYILNALKIAPFFGSAYGDQTTKACLNIKPDHSSNLQRIKGISIEFTNSDSESDAIFIDVLGAADGVNSATRGSGTAIVGKAEGTGTGGFFTAAENQYFALETSTGKVHFAGSVGVGNDSPAQKLDVNGNIKCGDGLWNGGHFLMGNYHLWIDTSGRLRIKNGTPTSATDGTVVGTQS